MKKINGKLSLQWRLTLITALLMTVTCILMLSLIHIYPLELRDFTTGLLWGISSADLMPCAFKCVITLKPQELTEAFRHQLLFTKKDLKRWEQLNMLLIDNMEK